MAGVANVSHAQNYDSVVIEKKYFNPYIDNLVFKRNKSFNYKISISDSTNTYDICILKNGEIRKIETKSTGTDSILAKLKIVSFKIIKPGFLKRTNKF
ncbi:hypothetical protein INR75_15230 [Zunongwangia sp. SCSIO 43204]|uniref:hypothetical protein n=1 Tax=Zunongwangia sp. SCSIO 43204 TaxID=2779359 RepID=UPI001CAA2181|nr:hypothetical protein [Zunongwangia sp. SCSIO 43204]UAB83514.1 hypothetical protein INR75_15230 [Zunongwangia sp. SCSIO 43204]